MSFYDKPGLHRLDCLVLLHFLDQESFKGKSTLRTSLWRILLDKNWFVFLFENPTKNLLSKKNERQKLCIFHGITIILNHSSSHSLIHLFIVAFSIVWFWSCLELLLHLFVDFLHLLDSIHGHVGVVHDGVGVQGSSLEQISNEGSGHDLGDELDQQGEANQSKDNGQGSVQESLAWESDVNVASESKTSSIGTCEQPKS